jgi:hypothetical protein
VIIAALQQPPGAMPIWWDKECMCQKGPQYPMSTLAMLGPPCARPLLGVRSSFHQIPSHSIRFHQIEAVSHRRIAIR